MSIRQSPSRFVFLVFAYILLAGIGLACLAPVLHTFAASFSDPVALTANRRMLIWPVGTVTLKGYEIVLKNNSIWTGYMNTLIYVAGGAALGIFATTIAAYIFSRKYFLPGNVCMLIISFTMLFNGGIIPNYILMTRLGLINTRLVLILPTAINVFNLVVLRTAFQAIPESLEEAAKLDGAGELYFLYRIVVPLSKATIAVIVLFISVSQWNSWFPASIYQNRRELYPLQIVLREILLQGNASLTSVSADIASTYSLYNILTQFCTIVVSIVPILCVYPFLQKHFAKGVMIGAIKG